MAFVSMEQDAATARTPSAGGFVPLTEEEKPEEPVGLLERGKRAAKQIGSELAEGVRGLAQGYRTVRLINEQQGAEYGRGLAEQATPEVRARMEARAGERTAGAAGLARDIATSESESTFKPRPVIQQISQAKTAGEAWQAFKSDPINAIVGITAQSAPAMVPALIVGMANAPAGVSTMGLSSAATEFGSSLMDYMTDRGLDPKDANAVQQYFSDPAQLQDAVKYAATRAGIIGAADLATAGIATKTLAPAGLKRPLARQAVNIPTQMAVQAAGGAGGEAGGQLATKGEITDPGAVLLEAVGELGGAPAEVLAFGHEAKRVAAAAGKKANIDLTQLSSTTNEETGETVFHTPSGQNITKEQWDNAGRRLREVWLEAAPPRETIAAERKPAVGPRVDEALEAAPPPKSERVKELERLASEAETADARKELERQASSQAKSEETEFSKLAQADDLMRLAAKTKDEEIAADLRARALKLRGAEEKAEPEKPAKAGLRAREETVEHVEAKPVKEPTEAEVNKRAAAIAEEERAEPAGPSRVVETRPEPAQLTKTRSESPILKALQKFGGIKESEMSDMGIEKKTGAKRREQFFTKGGQRVTREVAVRDDFRVGKDSLFRKDGKLGIDNAAEWLQQHGYLADQADHERAREIIRKELAEPGSMKKIAAAEEDMLTRAQQQRDEEANAATIKEARALGIETEGRPVVEVERALVQALDNDWTKKTGQPLDSIEHASIARRASDIDEQATHDAAVRHGDDEAGFIRAAQEIIDAHEKRSTAGERKGAEPAADQATSHRAAGEGKPQTAAAKPGREAAVRSEQRVRTAEPGWRPATKQERSGAERPEAAGGLKRERAAEVLRGTIESLRGKMDELEAKRYDASIVDQPKTPQHRLAQAVAQVVFDADIHWFTQKGRPLTAGFKSPRMPKSIFLEAVHTPFPAMAVTGHEMLHEMKANNPEVYNTLVKSLLPHLQDISKHADKLPSIYRDAEGKVNQSKALEELVADIVGDRFTEPEFWQEVARLNPTRFEGIAKYVMTFIDKVVELVTKRRPFGTEQYLTDLNKARTAVAQALDKYHAGIAEERDLTASVKGAQASFKVNPETDAFKRWFGDSKVVDGNGKPLVVYHGTDAKVDFSSFKRSPRGIFFSDSPQEASSYATEEGIDNARLVPAYLKVESPYVMTAEDSAANKAADVRGFRALRTYQTGLFARAQAAGHDGMQYAGAWVVFDPRNIKSAIGNRGTFDSASADIRMARETGRVTSEDLEAAGADASKMAAHKEAVDARIKEFLGEKAYTWMEQNGLLRPTWSWEDTTSSLARDQDVPGYTGVREGQARVVLYYDRIQDLNHVPALLMHEIGTHFGMRRMLGEEGFKAALEQIRALKQRGDPVFSEAWQRVKRDYINEQGKPFFPEGSESFLEEVAAAVVESQPQDSFVKRLISQVRAWVHQNISPRLAGKMDESLLKGLALAALRKAGRGELSTEAIPSTPDQAATDVMMARPGRNPPPKSVATTHASVAAKWLDFFNRHFLDSFSQLKKRQLAGVRGALSDAMNAYAREQLMHGRATERLKDLNSDYLAPIIKIAGHAELTREDVSDGLYAIHAPEANAYIATINPQLPDGGSGLANRAAQQILGSYTPEQRKALDKIDGIVQKMNRAKLDRMVSEGLITPQQRVDMQQRYKHWLSMKQLDDEDNFGFSGGGGLSVKGREFQARMGRFSEAEDPLSMTIRDAMYAVMRAEKNRVAVTFHNFAKANPNPPVYEEVTPANYPTQRIRDEQTGQVRTVPDPLALWREPEYFGAKINGEQKWIRVKDKLLAEQMKKLGDHGLDSDNELVRNVMKAVNTGTRLLSRFYTQFSPDFALVNPIRDVQQGVLVATALDKAKGKAVALRMLKNLPAALRDAAIANFHEMQGKHPGGLYDQFRQDGGTTGGFGLDDARTIQKEMERALAALNGDVKAKALLGVQTLLKPIMALNDSFENMTRFAAYNAALESGLTREQSAVIAKNVTVNFNKRGQATPVLNALYAFFNASMQANLAFVRATIRSRVAQTASLALLAAGAYAALSDDEDERGIDESERVSEFVQDRNFVVPYGERKAVKIPLAYGFNIPYATGRHLVRVFQGKESVAHMLGAILKLGFTTFLPTDSLVPTVAQPVADVVTGTDFAGRQIAKENPFDAVTPKSSQYKDNANVAAVAFFKALNAASGGSEFTKGVVDVSPEKATYLVKQYLGGLAAPLELAALPFAEKSTVADIPVVRRFVAEAKEDIYVTKAARIIREAEGRRKEIEAGASSKPGEEEYVQTVRAYESALRRLSAARNRMLKEDKKADVSEIDEQRNLLADQVLTARKGFQQEEAR